MNCIKVTFLVFLTSLLLTQSHSKPKFISKLIAKTFAEQEGNVVFSPLNVVANLGVIYLGSSEHTYEVFAKAFKISDAAELSDLLQKILTSINNIEGVTLETANKVYIFNNYKLNSTFLSLARNYLAKAQAIDFTHNFTINEWISQKTKGKIQKIASQNDFDHLTTLVLLNAIYFKSEWCYKFNEAETVKNDLFFLRENETRWVNMMRMKANVGYGENPNFDAKILQLPYKSNKISMVIVLPNKIDGIFKLQQKLLNLDIDTDILSKIRESTVSIKIPKFAVESNIDLKQPLSEIGLEEIFTTNSNFSRLLETESTSPRLYIEKMMQKARIEINEEGSEAADATVSTLRAVRQSEAKAQNSYRFVANRPFLFFIVCRHPLGTGILFSGRITTV